MKGDYSRLTFNKDKHYSSVRLQQGRVQLDSDWNEQIDIQLHRERTETRDVIGLTGAPEEGGGFKINVTQEGDNLTLSQGRIYVDGIICENKNETTLTNQPNLPNYDLPEEDGLYLVYLDLWERHITVLDAPEIREAALGGPDTTTRTKITWKTELLRLGDAGTVPAAVDETPQWKELVTPSTGKLIARKTAVASQENQLYRIEIHKAGETGSASFKWSRNNATETALLGSISGNQITLKNQGLNERSIFKPGQWVELSDDSFVLQGKPGILVELAEVTGNILKVKKWPVGKILEQIDTDANPMVRLWGPQGAISVTVPDSNDGYIPLEGGVEIKFEPGNYRSGDYWLIPVRAISQDINWPQNDAGSIAKSSQGIQHHFCQLAMVEYQDKKFSIKGGLRPLFAPLTKQAAGAGVSRQIFQSNHGFNIGHAIYYDATESIYRLASSDSEFTTGMFLVSAVRSAHQFTLLQAGYIDGLTDLIPGEYYFVSAETPGGLVAEEPLFGLSNPILFADTQAGGYVLPYRPAETSQEMLKDYVDGLLVGSITAFAMETPPEGWLECNGQALSRTEYARLFNRIGLTFGPGDGDTTFNAPDLRGEFIRGWDGGALGSKDADLDKDIRTNKLGEIVGNVIGSYQNDQMQSHKHDDKGHKHFRNDNEEPETPMIGKYPNGTHSPHESIWVSLLYSIAEVKKSHAIITDPTESSAGVPRHGKESRPRNIVLMYCIKY